MKKLMGTTKYLLWESGKAAAGYYLVILLISCLTIWAAFSFSGGGGMNGMEMSTFIFMFVMGLNSFKPHFRFLQSNCISRKRFYLSTLMAFPVFAAIMTAADLVIYGLLNLITSYESMIFQLFNSSDLGARLAWMFTSYLMALCLGFLITMLYYRVNPFLKLLISVSPVLIFMLFVYAIRNWGNTILLFLREAIRLLTGFDTPYAVFRTSLSFFVFSLVLMGLSFLLIRRMPLKNR